MAVGGGLTEIAKKKRERQRRQGKIYSSECRVPKTSKERESLPNRSKKQMKPIEWKRLEISSRKLRDTKGTFHAKMGTIKDRNGMGRTEADDIKKRWQEYIEELYKQDLHDPDNHDGVITHLEQDIFWSAKSSES